ncbi:MAG: hypothetical protein NVS1B3_12120 [Candidatus Dormibacteraceae bacterium]
MSLEPETEGTVTPPVFTPWRDRCTSLSLLRRLALVVSIVFCGSLALAAAAVAAGGKLAPGEYVFTSTSATATLGTGKVGAPAQGFNVYVNRGLNSFEPEDGNGVGMVTNNTIVSVAMYGPNGGAYGCFVIDPSEFTVNDDLQSASLHTTLTAAKACPGYGAPVTGKTDVTTKAGGGGGAIPLPMTLNLTWKGFGVTATSRDRSSFDCLDYSTESTYVSHSSGAVATGTVSALSGPFRSDVAGVSSTDSYLNISGTPNAACFSF